LGGKIASFGPFPTDLFLNTSTVNLETSLPGALVLACNDYLCIMKLGQDAAKDGSLTETHSAPISCAAYNSKLRQVKKFFVFENLIFYFILFEFKVNNMFR